MINRKTFFDKVRVSLFAGKLTTMQVKQMLYFIQEFEQQKLNDKRWLAYIFATVYHETGLRRNGVFVRTMEPVEESGRGAGKPYGSKLKYGGGPGKRVPYTKPDKIYYGRGHTQNTWYEIHEALTNAAQKAGKSWDFLNHPELLLQTEPSVWATFTAMQSGLYTGRKLSAYFNATANNPVNARQIINGLDKAELIAGYHRQFLEALNS